jgi:hypothetical protein
MKNQANAALESFDEGTEIHSYPNDEQGPVITGQEMLI